MEITTNYYNNFLKVYDTVNFFVEIALFAHHPVFFELIKH